MAYFISLSAAWHGVHNAAAQNLVQGGSQATIEPEADEWHALSYLHSREITP